MFRVVQAGYATLGELSTTVTRQQVLDSCDWLDALDEAREEQEAREKARSGKG